MHLILVSDVDIHVAGWRLNHVAGWRLNVNVGRPRIQSQKLVGPMIETPFIPSLHVIRLFLSTNLLLILSVALFMPVLARSARPRPRSRHCCTKLLELSVSLTAGRCDCWFLQLPSLETRPTAKQCVYKSRQASLKAHSGGATA